MTRRNCTLFPDNQNLCNDIVIVKETVGSISVIGCFFIIGVIWLFKKYQIFTQRLILYLSIAALLDSVAFLMPGYVPDGTLCEFQAFWLSFFDWAVLMWACCITFNLYQNAIRAVRTERFEIWYHVASWGISLIVSCLPFSGDHYGPAGVWCWIDANSSHSQIWRFTTWYIPLWLLLAVMLITYIYIVFKLRQEASRWEGTYRPEDERQKEMLKKDIKHLRAYPIVYMLLSVFPSAHRIQNAFEDKAVFWLMLLHAICSPLQGAVNALVFACDRETMQLLTWTSIKETFLQRTHPTTHLITEYTFAQTSGSSTPSPDGTPETTSDEEGARVKMDVDLDGKANSNVACDDDDANRPDNGTEKPSIVFDSSSDNIQERSAHGSSDVI